MRLLRTLFALLVLFVFNLHCVVSKSCPAMGCTDGASGRKIVNVTLNDLVGSVVTICRNDVCSTGKIVAPPCDGCDIDIRMTGPLSQTSVFFLPNNPLKFDPRLDASTPTLTYETTSFDVVFRVESGPVADGDTYVVTVAQEGAAPIVSLRKTVTYSLDQPNGADCDGTYGCKVATID